MGVDCMVARARFLDHDTYYEPLFGSRMFWKASGRTCTGVGFRSAGECSCYCTTLALLLAIQLANWCILFQNHMGNVVVQDNSSPRFMFWQFNGLYDLIVVHSISSFGYYLSLLVSIQNL